MNCFAMGVSPALRESLRLIVISGEFASFLLGVLLIATSFDHERRVLNRMLYRLWTKWPPHFSMPYESSILLDGVALMLLSLLMHWLGMGRLDAEVGLH